MRGLTGNIAIWMTVKRAPSWTSLSMTSPTVFSGRLLKPRFMAGAVSQVKDYIPFRFSHGLNRET